MMSVTRKLFVSGLLAAVIFAQAQVAAAAQTFPSLGGYLIGSPHNYDQQEAHIAKLGVVLAASGVGLTGVIPPAVTASALSALPSSLVMAPSYRIPAATPASGLVPCGSSAPAASPPPTPPATPRPRCRPPPRTAC